MNASTTSFHSEGPFTFEGYTFYSPEHHIDRPHMRWLVDGVLPETGLGCIYGAPGTGKSFLCLDIAAKMALGCDWFGFSTSPGAVLYIALEGEQGFHDRIKAWEAYNEIVMPPFVRFMYNKIAITDAKAVAKLADAIKTCDDHTQLVIIDTLNRASPGADENSSKDMGQIIAGASALQSSIGGLVLLIHHDGKDATRGLRGHSSLLGALDVALKVEHVGKHYQWRIAKLKDGQDGTKHEFKLVEATYTTNDGEIVSSLAVAPEGALSIDEKPRKPLGPNQNIVLSQFKVLMSGRELMGEPDKIPYDDAVKAVQDHLAHLDSKHRSTRAKEALLSLVKQDYLLIDADQCLSLAAAESEAQ